MEGYTTEILERNKFVKFLSVISFQDKTCDRNVEQAQVYENLYDAEKTKDYLTLYESIDREWNADEGSLHKRLEGARLDGKKIFPDYEHVMQYKKALEEFRKQKQLTINQRIIKKLNETIKENEKLTNKNRIFLMKK